MFQFLTRQVMSCSPPQRLRIQGQENLKNIGKYSAAGLKMMRRRECSANYAERTLKSLNKTSTFFIGSLRAGIQYRIEPIRSHSGSKSHEACVLKSMFSSNVEQANCKLKTELIWDYLTKMTMPARILSQPLQNK